MNTNKLRILIIADGEWNDLVLPNDVLTNWFTGFDAEFAYIYCSPGQPYNHICRRYFQITDSQMLKSMLGKGKAGKVIEYSGVANRNLVTNEGLYNKLKQISLVFHTPMMILRDIIWKWGRYDKRTMMSFINDFAPDIVFCCRLGSPKMFRLERFLYEQTHLPMVAFTGDDEATFKHFSLSPLYWLRKWYIYRDLKNTAHIYKHYFTFSEQLSNEYEQAFNLKSSTLYKCTDKSENTHINSFNTPIQIVYAGRLYCNRWKTLSAIGDALKRINTNGVKIVLNVYTGDLLTKKQQKALTKDKYIYIKGRVSPQELDTIYQHADIALHVESFDLKNKLATRCSFSTKIIDLLASGCAIMAICWNEHAGYQYLEKNKAAFCIDDYSKIYDCLKQIVDNPEITKEYGQKAFECSQNNHSRFGIQNQIKSCFNLHANE